MNFQRSLRRTSCRFEFFSFALPFYSLDRLTLRLDWSLLCKNCPIAKPVGVGAVSQRLVPTGKRIWIVDVHRDDGKRFIVRSDEKLTAFLELERITHELALSALLGDDSH